MLKQNEHIDDLEYKGFKIIQNEKKFKFGIDAVLLADFAKEIRAGAQVLDLGTGTGIISILLAAKTDIAKIYGIEIQEEMADMASRSVKLNNLQNKIEIINVDLKTLDQKFDEKGIDAIVVNPPYQKSNSGKVSENEADLISRHEIKCTLEDICSISAKLLKEQGTLYMVHRPERLSDIIYEMKKNKIEPKKIKFIKSKLNTKANLILVKGVKMAKPFLNVEKDLIVYEENGDYSQEILKIYGKI